MTPEQHARAAYPKARKSANRVIADLGKGAKVEYIQDPRALAEMLQYRGPAPLVTNPALLRPVPAPEWQASPESRAASQQYLDSKRRPSVAPWFFVGIAAGMALYAAMDAFLRGGL
jgi:hypothetical protein